jgi:RNA polymerase sigma-70 factor (ECF subfamily)
VGQSGAGAISVTGRAARAETFVELLRPLQRPLEAYCRRMAADRSEVEDILQSAVAAAFAQFDRYAQGTNFKAWIFRFVTLEIFNRNRKQTAIPLGEAAADLPAEESWGLVACQEVHDALLDDPDAVLEHFDEVVAAALQRLPTPERAVLLLRAIGEFSYKDIHDLLSIPLGSVMGYLSRARQRLRLALAEYAAERGLLPRSHLPQRPAS